MERGVSIALGQFLKQYVDMEHPPERLRYILCRIRDCRTAVMGGRRMACPVCGDEHVLYNSCRDRHCPNCQGASRQAWLLARKEELLLTTYFHVVFTIPDVLHPYVLMNMREAYNALFSAAWGTLSAFASGKRLRMGMTALLHTWGSNLSFHPHLHCIVPGGGIDEGVGRWKTLPQIKDGKGSEPFLFPVKAMGVMFRAKFMATFTAAVKLPEDIRAKCFSKPWVVYAKSPVCGADKTLEYLARYAFRVAISNERIVEVNDKMVSFTYKDYRNGGTVRTMTVDGCEFVRRYALHVLPEHLVRIRHFGLLSTACRNVLRGIQEQLGMTPLPKKRQRRRWAQVCEAKGMQSGLCPSCMEGILLLIEIIPRIRSPEYKVFGS